MEEIPKEAIKAIDRLYLTTKERASIVHALIGNIRDYLREQNIAEGRRPGDGVPSDMDLLCYAIEYTGSQAIAFGDENFLVLAQHINIWLQSVHYSNPANLWGEPDRKVEEDDTVSEEGSEVRGSGGCEDSDGGIGDPGTDSEVQGDSEGDSNGDVSGDEDEPGNSV